MKKQSGVVVILVLGVVLVIITSTIVGLFNSLALDAKYDRQVRVVESIDKIIDSYSSYYVAMCNVNSNSIPSIDVPTLQSDGWHLFPIYNPNNATITLSMVRPTVTTSHSDKGSRSLNNSSTVLHVNFNYPSSSVDNFMMLVDALKETGLVINVDKANTSVDIQDQVINRRLSSELLDEAVFNDRSCI